MSETTGSTLCFVQIFHFHPFSLFVTRNHHLSNAFSVFNDKLLGRQVNQNDSYLSAVVGINRSR